MLHNHLNSTRCIQFSLVAACLLTLHALAADFPIPRRLPPPGRELDAEVRSRLDGRLRELERSLADVRQHELSPDAEVFLKAVKFALLHGEFYGDRDVAQAWRALEQGQERLNQLKSGFAPWGTQRGLVVRGYRSRIDDSVQPYGLVIPDDVDFSKPVPLYVWLHGRGDQATDLHFIDQRQSQVGQIKPPGAIVLHPFGRHCLGFKSAGEIDVLEAIGHVQQQYRIDPDRVVLMGFSMGGAGAWHLGAHYADHWVAMSPGAGFAETARYQNLRPANYPPWYEQQLWGCYDVPAYVRNLFNLPVVAYSGELDRQIQAARVMEEAFREHGRELTHLIGPGMGHQYHDETLAEILRRMDEAVRVGRNRRPTKITLQTRTLRYHRLGWVAALGLGEHWQDARIDAEIAGDKQLRVETRNVTALELSPWPDMRGVALEIDGQELRLAEGEPKPVPAVSLERTAGGWRTFDPAPSANSLRKQPGLQGPIDDVFLEPFLVVTPSGRSDNALVQNWIDFELQHLADRWRALFRGELRSKPDREVTPDDLQKYHLVAWGTPQTNSLLARLAEPDSSLPIRWDAEQVRVGERAFDAESHVPCFIYPRGDKYLVVNSGPTFREAHDRTNSLQNPKLPDWYVLDLRQPPNDETPGKVVAADFFDEAWQLKPHAAKP